MVKGLDQAGPCARHGQNFRDRIARVCWGGVRRDISLNPGARDTSQQVNKIILSGVLQSVETTLA